MERKETLEHISVFDGERHFEVETRKCVIIFLLKSSRDCGKRGIINNEEESSSYQMSSLLMEEPRGSVGMKVYVGYVYV